MKKLYKITDMKKLLALLLLFTGMVNAQVVNIPDEAFKVKLIALGIDTNGDGEIQQSEALAVTTLDVKNSNILFMDGIEAFTNLTSLICGINFTKTLNVSALTNLTTLKCSNSQISTLNVSGLTNLQTLNCDINELSSLNLSGLTNLQSLNCNGNSLTSLNLTGLNNLQILSIGSNPFPSMNAITGITPNLLGLYCNALQLTSLNLTPYPNLKELGCGQNLFASFSDITGLTNNIESLYLNFGQTTTVNLSPFTNLKTLQCEGLFTSLNLSGLVHLETLFCRNNSLTSLDLTGLTNLKNLYCSDNQLTSLDLSGLTHLENLYVHNNPLTLNLTGITTITNLACNYEQLTSLDFSALTALQTLTIYGNSGATSLNLTGLSNLKTFNCTGMGLTSLNLTGLTSLESLACGENQLTSLDLSGLNNLQILSCQRNLLTSLNLTGLTNLKQLGCDSNQITSLDLNGLPNLSAIFCNQNQLTSLDVSSLTNLTYLDCSNNQISQLNLTNSPNLEGLRCSDNTINSLSLNSEHFKLHTLDYSSNPLPNLDFSIYNQITSLRLMNTGRTSLDVFNLTKLYALACTDNPIPTIDVANNYNLAEIYCGSPALTSLFMKNGSNESLGFVPSPNLQFICTDDSQTLSVQTYVNDSGFTNCVVNSYCSFVPGGNYNTITGASLFDANNNGCDASDVMQPNIKFNINDGTIQGSAFTNTLGNYSFYTQTGSFDISPNVENPSWYNFSPTSYTVPFANNINNVSTNNFCIAPVGVHNDLEVVVFPINQARPGFDATYKMVYKNKGNQVLSGNVTLAFDDSRLDFVSASPAVSLQVMNNLNWTYSGLLPFESRSIEFVLNVNSPLETPAVNIFDFLNFTASITPVVGDELPLDNQYDYTQTVVGSFDPNDIVCLEGNTVEPSEIGKYLHYAINFENTGTFYAENVVVRDEIDTTKYDINSLQLLSTSHNVYTRITGNVVEFIFNNIQLAASAGDPPVGGHGDILFKIKTKDDLVVNDVVSKQANIYFDYNAPVNTLPAETVFATLSNTGFDLDNSITIYPNPTASKVNINADTNIKSIALYDIQGRLLQTLLGNQNVLDITNQANGIYFLKITTDKGSKVEKLVKK